MGKETILYYDQLDALEVGHRIDIPTHRHQSYRNNANFLKKATGKIIAIKKVTDRYVAVRIE